MSNDSTKYSRNEVRHVLLPYLRERFNASVDDAILRLSEIAQGDNLALDTTARDWLQNREVIKRSDLDELSIGLQRRALQIWLNEICGVSDITFDHIERIRTGDQKAWILPGNNRVLLSKGYLILDHNPAAESRRLIEPIAVTVPGTYDFDGWTISLSGNVPAGLDLIVRLPGHGDRIELTTGHKKLSDAYGEEKVPMPERWNSPVLVDLVEGDVLAGANLRRICARTPNLKFSATLIKAAQNSEAAGLE